MANAAPTTAIPMPNHVQPRHAAPLQHHDQPGPHRLGSHQRASRSPPSVSFVLGHPGDETPGEGQPSEHAEHPLPGAPDRPALRSSCLAVVRRPVPEQVSAIALRQKAIANAGAAARRDQRSRCRYREHAAEGERGENGRIGRQWAASGASRQILAGHSPMNAGGPIQLLAVDGEYLVRLAAAWVHARLDGTLGGRTTAEVHGAPTAGMFFVTLESDGSTPRLHWLLSSRCVPCTVTWRAMRRRQ